MALCVRLSRFARNCYDFADLLEVSFKKALAAELKRIEPARVMSAIGSKFLSKMNDIPYQLGDQASAMIAELLAKTAYKCWYEEAVKVADWCREHEYTRPIFREGVEELIKEDERLFDLLEG